MKEYTITFTEQQLETLKQGIQMNKRIHNNPEFQAKVDANNAFKRRLLDKLAYAKPVKLNS